MRKLVVVPTAAVGPITTASGSSPVKFLFSEFVQEQRPSRKPSLEALARVADSPELILVEEEATLIEGADRSPQTHCERIYLF